MYRSVETEMVEKYVLEALTGTFLTGALTAAEVTKEVQTKYYSLATYNQVYRVLKNLEKDGLVKKEGTRYFK